MDLSFKNFLVQNTLTLRDIPDKTGEPADDRPWEIPPFDAETEITIKEIEGNYLAWLEGQGEGNRQPAAVMEHAAAMYQAEQLVAMIKSPSDLDAEQLVEKYHTFTMRSIVEGAKSLFRYGFRAEWMGTGR